VNGASGKADANALANSGQGSVTTTAHAPSAAIAASAAAGANTHGAGSLIPIAPGQAASNATLYSDSGGAAGAMSAGYGGSGETLTYSAEADFSFSPLAPEKLYLTLLGNNAGAGFDSLRFEVDLNGTAVVSEFTTSLADAEAFFSDRAFDFGVLAPGAQTLDLKYVLTASGIGDGFGFTYETSVPEPETWAMMLLGFAGLGAAYAGGRRPIAA
jgi:hypothetical protein